MPAEPCLLFSHAIPKSTAVVWRTEYYDLYVYGSTFTVRTDHEPLLGIFKSSKPTSARIERWRLRLTPYYFNLVYKPGRDDNNPADFLGRHPSTTPKEDSRNIAEKYVNYIYKKAVPKAMSLNGPREATAQDKTMLKLQQAIKTQHWNDTLLRPYKSIRSEFALRDGIILRGTHLIIPEALQQQAVDLAHVGPQEVVKTTSLLREKVWFPGIVIMVEREIRPCIPRQATTRKSTNRQPLKTSSLPQASWCEVSIDFAGPPPNYMLLDGGN